MKQRSLGVTVFAISLLYFPLMLVWKFIRLFKYASQMHAAALQQDFLRSFLPSFCFQMPIAILFFVLTFGLIRLKKWSYFLIIIVASFSVITAVIGILTNLLRYGRLLKLSHPLEEAATTVYSIVMLLFFIHPKVKALFIKPGPAPEGDPV